MKDKLKKLLHLSFFLIFCNFTVFSQVVDNQGYTLDYYGVVSNDLGNNMSTTISDLYFTQLSEIPNFVVFDKRSSPDNRAPSQEERACAENPIFYTEILKDEAEEKWTLTYIMICNEDEFTDTVITKQKIYDSFYKIFMESKVELEDSIKAMIGAKKEQLAGAGSGAGAGAGAGGIIVKFGSSNSVPVSQGILSGAVAQNSGSQGAGAGGGAAGDGNLPLAEPAERLDLKSVEMLSGTWKGEAATDKIVILRGGRGFIIFDNGASMNIGITVEDSPEGQFIVIKQKGNSNASFYPELPRKIALLAAVSAPPMEWTMVLLDNMVLEGTKTTLIQQGDSFTISNVPVCWEKID